MFYALFCFLFAPIYMLVDRYSHSYIIIYVPNMHVHIAHCAANGCRSSFKVAYKHKI